MGLFRELDRARSEWDPARDWAFSPRALDPETARLLLAPREGEGGRIDLPRLTPLFSAALVLIAIGMWTAQDVYAGLEPWPLWVVVGVPLLWVLPMLGPELRWGSDHVSIGGRRVAWEQVRVHVGLGMVLMRVTDGVGGWALRPVRGSALFAGRVRPPRGRGMPRA